MWRCQEDVIEFVLLIGRFAKEALLASREITPSIPFRYKRCFCFTIKPSARQAEASIQNASTHVWSTLSIAGKCVYPNVALNCTNKLVEYVRGWVCHRIYYISKPKRQHWSLIIELSDITNGIALSRYDFVCRVWVCHRLVILFNKIIALSKSHCWSYFFW